VITERPPFPRVRRTAGSLRCAIQLLARCRLLSRGLVLLTYLLQRLSVDSVRSEGRLSHVLSPALTVSGASSPRAFGRVGLTCACTALGDLSFGLIPLWLFGIGGE
jgi:hypothetical protein